MGGGYPSGNVFQWVRVFGKSSTVCFDWIVKGEAARLRLTSGNLGLQLDHIGCLAKVIPSRWRSLSKARSNSAKAPITDSIKLAVRGANVLYEVKEFS